MKKLEVCFSPLSIGLFDVAGKIVVVTDILRATSSMVSGMASGLEEIVPVADVADCLPYKAKGYLLAGERNGEKLPGFDLGNSPFSFIEAGTHKAKVAMTTTNGTQAIALAAEAKQIIIGAFLNLTAVARYVAGQSEDVLIVCAGWKNRFSTEDTLFAGALTEALSASHQPEGDEAWAAHQLFVGQASGNVAAALMQTSHAQRLNKNSDNTKDLAFCAEIDRFDVVPMVENGKISS